MIISSPKGSPLAPFFSCAAITVGLFLFGGVMFASRYYEMLAIETTAGRLTELGGTIMRIDEAQTMSVKMAVATGELQWEQRYREVDPMLDAAIHEAQTLAPGCAQSQALLAEVADAALDAMDEYAFAAVRRGDRGAAAAVLDDHYEAMRKIYVDAMDAAMRAIGHDVRIRIAQHRHSLIAAIAIAATALICTTLLWLRVLTQIRAYIHDRQKLEAIGRLAAGVAREIKTPIQYVSDNVEFLRESLAELLPVVERRCTDDDGLDLPYLREHMPRALDHASEGLSRMATIVRSMKLYAHERQDRSLVDLNDALTSTLAIAHSEYKYVAELVTELGELPRVSCYAGELNQVFLNLVVNASHAIGDVVDKTGARGRITVSTRRDGDAVIVAIADTGTGIPAQIRDRVFDAFFTTKEAGRGTGQGLSHARAVIVDKHHGSLTFDTAPGAGTTFYVRLPIEPA